MEEEKKAIERSKEILKEWQEIVDIEDTVEREIEMTLYAEDMPFNELKILVNLVEQLEKENKELKNNNKIIEVNALQVIETNKYLKENSIPKSVIRDKIKDLESYKGLVMYEKYNYESTILHLKEILGDE